MNLSDCRRNYIADRINNLHLALCCYSSVGWLSQYHSRILVFLLPSMMFNWLMDDNKCCVTRLEDYFRVNKEKNGEGFIENKLKSNNVDLKGIDIDKCISGITYVLFLLSYNNAFGDNTLCLIE